MRIFHQLTKRDCNRTMDTERVYFVQEKAKTRSTRAPFLRLSETTGDNGMKIQTQKRHCKNSVFCCS